MLYFSIQWNLVRPKESTRNNYLRLQDGETCIIQRFFDYQDLAKNPDSEMSLAAKKSGLGDGYAKN